MTQNIKRNEQIKRWRENNSEKWKLIISNSYQRNKEKRLAYDKEYKRIAYYYRNTHDEFLLSIRKLYPEPRKIYFRKDKIDLDKNDIKELK
jgi:hypothetical protein